MKYLSILILFLSLFLFTGVPNVFAWRVNRMPIFQVRNTFGIITIPMAVWISPPYWKPIHVPPRLEPLHINYPLIVRPGWKPIPPLRLRTGIKYPGPRRIILKSK